MWTNAVICMHEGVRAHTHTRISIHSKNVFGRKTCPSVKDKMQQFVAHKCRNSADSCPIWQPAVTTRIAAAALWFSGVDCTVRRLAITMEWLYLVKLNLRLFLISTCFSFSRKKTHWWLLQLIENWVKHKHCFLLSEIFSFEICWKDSLNILVSDIYLF